MHDMLDKIFRKILIRIFSTICTCILQMSYDYWIFLQSLFLNKSYIIPVKHLHDLASLWIIFQNGLFVVLADITAPHLNMLKYTLFFIEFLNSNYQPNDEIYHSASSVLSSGLHPPIPKKKNSFAHELTFYLKVFNIMNMFKMFLNLNGITTCTSYHGYDIYNVYTFLSWN